MKSSIFEHFFSLFLLVAKSFSSNMSVNFRCVTKSLSMSYSGWGKIRSAAMRGTKQYLIKHFAEREKNHPQLRDDCDEEYESNSYFDCGSSYKPYKKIAVELFLPVSNKVYKQSKRSGTTVTRFDLMKK